LSTTGNSSVGQTFAIQQMMVISSVIEAVTCLNRRLSAFDLKKP